MYIVYNILFERVSPEGPARIFEQLPVSPNREGGGGLWCTHLKLYKSKENKTGNLHSTEREINKSKLYLAQVYIQFPVF